MTTIKNPTKILITILILIGCIASVYGARHFTGYRDASLELSQTKSKSKGNPLKAKFKVVEYIDFQCGACKKGAEIMNQFVESYPDEIYFEVRNFPVSQMHRYAGRAALYAECAAKQGKYWEMHDKIFEHQEEWSKHSNAEIPFRKYTRDLGLDVQALFTCLKEDSVRETIVEEKKNGFNSGVRMTPSYFVNGELMVGYFDIQKKFDDHFKEKDD